MSRSTKGHLPFEQDAIDNRGYRYTTAAPTSAKIANQRLTELTVQWIRRLKNIKTVMDIGCGDGTYTAAVAKKFPKLSFKGCDPATSAIKLAKKTFPSISFSVADILKPRTLPKPTAQASILRGVIHHVPNAKLGVMNAVRYSHHVLVIEPNGWNPILKIIEVISPYHRAHGERSFTSRTLSRWVKDGGSRVTNISYVGLVPFFCPPGLATILKRVEPFVEQSLLAPLLCAQVILEIEKN